MAATSERRIMHLTLKLRLLIPLMVVFAAGVTAVGQVSTVSEVLTNDKVITMVQAGLSSSVIVNKIRASKTSFNTQTDELIRLKQARVPDDVINAMVNPNAAATDGNAAIDNGVPKEIGVYLKKDNQWLDVEPELVNWKTGGVVKSMVSLGVVKQDINGHLDGRQSRTIVSSAPDFMIVVPEGVSITEYQLIKLNQNDDDREFRTMTGGVFHAKGGATKDMVPFQSQKVASRTYTISLTVAKGGEYGFLPPGALTQLSGASTLGKMYTFSLAPVK
jgi:hypothetical protein